MSKGGSLREFKLKTPIKASEVKELEIGDIVYISGVIYTARDAAHKRLVEYVERGLNPPFNLKDSVIYHCGPIARKISGKWMIYAAGPTTSFRMEPYESTLIEKLGVRFIVGKGGMGAKTAEALRSKAGVYGSLTGGVAAITAKSIREVVEVYWIELGIPEAVWKLRVEEFGPIIVTIDSKGRNLHSMVEEKARMKLEEILRGNLGF